MGPDAGVRAGQGARAPLPAGAGSCGRACRPRGARCRQAAPAGEGRCAGAGPLPRVLRRRCRQGARRHHPLPGRLHGDDAARAAWRDRPHHPVERPDAGPRPQHRRCAGDGQRRRAEAQRGRLDERFDGGQARPGGGPAGGRAQHRHRPWRGGGRCARRASRHRPRLVHGLGRGRPAGAAGRGDARLPGHARARRQVAADRVRRCRSRGRTAARGQRRDAECRPDLLGRLAPAGRGPGLRCLRRGGRRALPHARRRPGRGRPRLRSADQRSSRRSGSTAIWRRRTRTGC